MPKLSIKKSGWCWWWVVVLVWILDQVTKHVAHSHLTAYVAWPVMPFLNFTLAYNKGAAFSFLHSASGWQTWFLGSIAVMASVGLCIWLRRVSCQQRRVCIALALIIGGALGNVWDRITLGHVVDFIDVYVKHWHWPAFNMADSAICVGAVILLVDAVRSRN